MFYINKFVWFFLQPVTIGLCLIILGTILFIKGKKKYAVVSLSLALSTIYFFSTLTAICLLGLPLERTFLDYESIEKIPNADAIVALGGGMGKAPNMKYPDMSDAADRIWHAARLWKAGKAPIIILSGKLEDEASKPLLLDLGIPESAILVDNESRNTYENSRFTEQVIKKHNPDNTKPTIIVVTSAWHLPRAMGNFSKTNLKAFPAPSDFKVSTLYGNADWWDFILPSPESLLFSNSMLKEWIGRLARK